MTLRASLFLAASLQAALLAQGPVAETHPRAVEAKDPARLAFAPKGRVDLGSVGPREIKVVQYTITNTSAAPITLKLVDLSPGVVVRGPAIELPFAPGQSQALTLTVDPTDFVGWQPRSVRLVTDDPRQGEYRLPLGMVVRPDMSVDALRKNLGSVAPHESPQAVFTFKRETGEPTVIKLVNALPPYVESEILPEGPVSRLQLTLRPALIPPGVALGLETLEVETNAPREPRFTLYLEWRLNHPIEPAPGRVVFLDVQPQTQDLQLKAKDGKPFLIEEAKVEGGGFTVSAPPAPANPQTLTITRTASASTRSLLVLRIKGQDQPLKVPLAYLPPTKAE